MKYLWWMLGVALVADASSAQQPVITPDTPVGTAMLDQWLHSGDPRLVAWAADFTRRKHDTAILAEMPDWLEHWPMPPIYAPPEWESTRLDRLPTLAVLDALIQENASVPISAINTVALTFPVQAAVLIGRHPLSESRPALEQWARDVKARGNGSQRVLARVALMMLAKDPGPSSRFWYEDPFQPLGLAGSVVAASEVKLRITVNGTGAARDLMGGGLCGDSEGRKPSPGWPPVYGYELLEDRPSTEQVPVVELNGYSLTAWRYESNGAGLGSCHGSNWLDADYIWHDLIAYWLGVKPQDMTWWPVQNFGIKWTSKAAYQQRLGEIVETERQRLCATVAALQQRGFLSASDAAVVMPKIVVTIECDLTPCPLQ